MAVLPRSRSDRSLRRGDASELIRLQEIYEDALVWRPCAALPSVIDHEGVTRARELDLSAMAVHTELSADYLFSYVGKASDARVVADDARVDAGARLDDAVPADDGRSSDNRARFDACARADEDRPLDGRVLEVDV